jgi:hypothetical protein
MSESDDLAVRSVALEMAVEWAVGEPSTLAEIVACAGHFERYLRGTPDPNLKAV